MKDWILKRQVSEEVREWCPACGTRGYAGGWCFNCGKRLHSKWRLKSDAPQRDCVDAMQHGFDRRLKEGFCAGDPPDIEEQNEEEQNDEKRRLWGIALTDKGGE